MIARRIVSSQHGTHAIAVSEAREMSAEEGAGEAESREQQRALMDVTWAERPGFLGWLSSVDNHSVAKRYMATAFVFLLLGGLEAGLIRLQLSRPENAFIGPDLYNQIFTMHGTTMMFLFAVPMMTAVGLYLVPMMVGARNIMFPRLNALGYWVYLIGGVFLYGSFFLNSGPDAGWFAYVPLSGPEYAPGKRMDVWAQTVTFTEIAGLIAAVQIIGTVFKQRAPGMSLNRIPIYVWTMLVTAFMIVFAMPSVATGSLFLAMDRLISTQFFNAAEGGDPLLWQHLFWFFGHPEVYIIFLPATGLVSAMLPSLTRRPVFGYTPIVLSIVATGFLAFGLWVHHMFAGPMPQLGQSFFTAASMLIAIPTGIQMFCWIATIWDGRPQWHTPLLFIMGFIVTFMIGGVTGVMVASVPFDLQAHDTYFVVAHLHYVLIGGTLFPLIGAIFFWWPKLTGRLLSERMGKLQFALFFTGVNVTFFPMHQLGLNGMTRRIYTYAEETGWGSLNLVASLGAVLIVVSMLLLLANMVRSLRSGRHAGPDPWRADSLEWSTPSPPPIYNRVFPPVVRSRSPLWEADGQLPVVSGLDPRKRQVLVTTVLDAVPDNRHNEPGPTVTPLLTGLAIGALFIVSVFTPWGLVIGAVLVAPPLFGWLWPRKLKEPQHEVVELPA